MSGLEKDAAKMLLMDNSDSGGGEEYPLTQTQARKPSSRKRKTVRLRRSGDTCVCSGKALLVFFVFFLIGCACGTLGYFVFQLKEDLKTVQGRVKTLESELETSTEQASTVSTLQQKIEKLQKLPAQLSSITRQIGFLNLTSSQLQAKVKATQDEIKALPTISIEGLQQSTAQLGSTIQGVQGTQAQHTEQINTLTSSLDELQTSLTNVQEKVTELRQAASVPTPGPGLHDPTSDINNPTRLSDIEKVIQSLQQGQTDESAVVSKLNSKVASLQLWKEDLMPRIISLESTSHTGNTSAGSLTEKVAQLQLQVDTLVSSIHSQTPDRKTGGQTQSPIASDTPKDWRQEIESEIQTIQKRLDNLNPRDLNNNLMNDNVTRGLQHQLERALSNFRAENLKSVDALTQDNQAIWGKLYQQHNDIVEIQHEVDDLLVRVQDLEDKEGLLPPTPTALQATGDLTTSESTADRSMTINHLQPITIEGIATPEDLEMKFFIMDENSDDFLTYDEMMDFLGPKAPPKEQFMQYDKNEDGKLDLAEMRSALGFPEQ